ncbi:hypothetical protein [Streptomyces sp. NPDC048473]
MSVTDPTGAADHGWTAGAEGFLAAPRLLHGELHALLRTAA